MAHPLWKQKRPKDAAWKPTANLSRSERRAEQDEAAGGREARELTLEDGRKVVASIALRAPPAGRRIYAYLRWSVTGKTQERYVCEVDDSSRDVNLAEAWRQARANGLVGQGTPEEERGR
jgi:DNA mismatch endonuclease (patch repair protein)